MNNGPNDGAASPRARGSLDVNSSCQSQSIKIESDDDCDDKSTPAERELLLPAPAPSPASTLPNVTSCHHLQPQTSGSTTINMDHLNQGQRTARGDARPSGSNILSTFLARQRSYTAVTSTPRATTQVNRRLQQSSSVGAQTYNSTEEPPAGPSAGGVRQLGFWRVFSLSSAPSTEALRTIIHSNFRYQPLRAESNAASVAAPVATGTTATANGNDNSHNQNPLPLSSRDTSSNAPAHITRSISLREGEIQHELCSINGRHIASAIDLTRPASSDGGANGPGSPGSSNGNNQGAYENNVDETQAIADMATDFLKYFVRYLPVIGILLIKFIHDHLLGILDILLLEFVVHLTNYIVREQVALLADKRKNTLTFSALFIFVVIFFRLEGASTSPDPLGLIVPPPQTFKYFEDRHNGLVLATENVFDLMERNSTIINPSVEPHKSVEVVDIFVPKMVPLGLLLYYITVSDLIIKLFTIFIKVLVTLLPINVMRTKRRARLYVLIEYISQLYRALCPITQWVVYLYDSYSGLEVISGVLFASLYLVAKIFELIFNARNLKNAIATLKSNIDSERSPTKEELDAAGAACPICHESYNSAIILECGHIFCDQCVQTWFKREQTCPMCRAKVSDDPAWQDGSTTYFHQLY